MGRSIVEEHRHEGRLIREWQHEGLACAMARSPMHGCVGYVQVPASVTLPSDDKYGYITLEVHGGITYGPDVDGWIGFDTGHAWDVWGDPDVPESRMERLMREIDGPSLLDTAAADPDWMIVWTLEKLEAEVNELAARVAALRSGQQDQHADRASGEPGDP